MSASADPITDPPEGSFIRLSTRRRVGVFFCAMCMSAQLRVDYEPYKHILAISCDRCGNIKKMNFSLDVSNVG